MRLSEHIIRDRALMRISELFNIPIALLRQDAQFGDDLKASYFSDFRHNKLDKVDQDIRDVADRKITKELNKGIITIRTVGEYCDHMVRCYETKPEDVKQILTIKPNKS